MIKISKLILIVSFLFFQNLRSEEYKKLNYVEMEIYRNNQIIGYSKYQFFKNDNVLKVINKTKFNVKIFGVNLFSIDSLGTEIYDNDQLISFTSKTLQNKKEKYVKLKLLENKNQFYIDGSSYKGKANVKNVIGNWWNHKILDTSSQISPLSGSVKKQLVVFKKEEIINQFGKNILTKKFSLKSAEINLPDDKRLNFEIWIDPKTKLIHKVSYERLGIWEYKLKKYN